MYRILRFIMVCWLLVAPAGVYALCTSPAGDLDGSGATSVADVQCGILGVLWQLESPGAEPPVCLGTEPLRADSDCDGVITVSDVVLTINAVLSLPLDPALDGNGDGCADACGCQPPDNTLFVRAEADPANADGASWDTALPLLSDALELAGPGDSIWVAAGVYSPTAAGAPVLTMKRQVRIVGGFVGTECSEDARPSPLASTTLDGAFEGTGERSPHVVLAASEALLDGFTITNGLAACDPNSADCDALGVGGGLLAREIFGLTLRDIRFVANRARARGGAAHFEFSQFVRIDRCAFIQNSAGSTPLVAALGTADGVEEFGGALSAQDSADVVISDCQFEVNSSTSSGGAMMLDGCDEVSLARCTFTGNAAPPGQGGAVYAHQSSSVELSDCQLESNLAERGAGIALVEGSNVDIVRCRFSSNQSNDSSPFPNIPVSTPTPVIGGGALFAFGISNMDLSESEFDANQSNFGGAAYIRASLVDIRRCQFTDNGRAPSSPAPTEAGGAVRFIEAAGGEVHDSRFVGNRATEGGAIAAHDSGFTTTWDCEFDGNTAAEAGGAVYSTNSSGASYYGTRFIENQSGFGAAVSILTGSGAMLDRCVFAFNGPTDDAEGPEAGGALRVSSFSTIVRSSFYANSGGSAGAAVTAPTANGVSVVQSSFLENGASPGGGAVYLPGLSSSIEDSIFFGNSGGPFADVQPALPAGTLPEITFTAMLAPPDAEGNIDLTDAVNPPIFAVPDGRVFLHHNGVGDSTYTSVGVDAGSVSVPDSPNYSLSTRTDGVPDSGQIDLGAHYVGTAYDCGDGVCSPELGENRFTCGLDCSARSCCTASADGLDDPLGGCAQPSCTECVCTAEPACCEGAWTEACLALAMGDCAAECPCRSGSCCVAADAATVPNSGCGNLECAAAVCQTEPECCEVLWDELCVGTASAREDCPECAPVPPEGVDCQSDVSLCTPLEFSPDSPWADSRGCALSETPVVCEGAVVTCAPGVCDPALGCLDAPVSACCGNGVCDFDFGEDSTGCPEDCCGDGVCEPSESCEDCPSDCGLDGQCSLGNLIITEVMVDPVAPISDANGEWFEVHNRGSLPVDMEGMTLSGGGTQNHQIASSVIVPPGGYAVFTRNADSVANGGLPAAYEYANLTFKNQPPDVLRIFGSTTLIDEIQIAFIKSQIAGRAYQLDADFIGPTANDDPANWCYGYSEYAPGQRGTPGQPNAVCAACGDGICQPYAGEDPTNCIEDCFATCNDAYACVAGCNQADVACIDACLGPVLPDEAEVATALRTCGEQNQCFGVPVMWPSSLVPTCLATACPTEATGCAGKTGFCGDGLCNTLLGETLCTCPGDCPGSSAGSCAAACTTGGMASGPCSCSTDCEVLGNCCADASDFCTTCTEPNTQCENGVCEPYYGESPFTCAADCP